ncbi:galactitol-1-phosphate 5-dehydrogenase [Pantoea rwandensis]|uniref:Galactitol-1-phosphate 5-dehydrogenase n=1 Tax=Pantoea rwandensis TaxID=1076550 RepID=A0A1X1D3I3_9GAMM|nr:galactitol-1-phosphate 5-dehydrogenase [Pantoea rwandensis]ORM71225.1 galactitol-1-phosphate 5-dehydrogenase [Pantoea rwandensis]
MKALNLYGKQDVRFEEVPMLKIERDDEVIIHVNTAGICGSDISRFGKIGSYNPGLTWGHEFSGVVAAVGIGVTSIKMGDRVVACPCFPCFECEYCGKSQYSKCSSLQVLGGHHKGAFAEYVSVPAANVVIIPDDLDYEDASFVEPSAVVVHGLDQVNIKAGSSVAVVGCGTIGQLAVQWARIYGAGKVYALDTEQTKLDIACSAGADAGYDVTAEGFTERFAEDTQGRGVDLVIESSGNAAGIVSSMNFARKGGAVLLLGIPYGDVVFDRTSFEKIIRNELTIRGSWNSLSAPFPGREWKTSLDYMQKGTLKPSLLITHRIGLKDAPNMLPKLYSRDFNFIKVLIDLKDI